MRRPSVRLAIGAEAPRSESKGHTCESCRVRHNINDLAKSPKFQRTTNSQNNPTLAQDRRDSWQFLLRAVCQISLYSFGLDPLVFLEMRATASSGVIPKSNGAITLADVMRHVTMQLSMSFER